MAEQLDLRWSNKSGYVAYTQAVSVDKIIAMAAILDTELGVAPLELPTFKEPDYDQAHKLEAIANWLELVVDTLYPAYAEAKADALAAAEAARVKAEAEAAKAVKVRQQVDAKLLSMSEGELIAYASTKGLGFSPNTLPETMVEAIHAHEQRLEAAKVEAANALHDASVAKIAADKVAAEAAEVDDDDQEPVYAPKHESAYSGKNAKQLKAIAKERGIDISGMRDNLDIIDALEAADTKGE